MHARNKPLLICDPGQERVELLTFFRVQRSANGIIVFARYAPNLLCRASACCGQMERIRAPILWIGTAFDQASFLKFIQKGNQPTWQD
jgi:hypothetical protein